jgi:WD40 repeat protein
MKIRVTVGTTMLVLLATGLPGGLGLPAAGSAPFVPQKKALKAENQPKKSFAPPGTNLVPPAVRGARSLTIPVVVTGASQGRTSLSCVVACGPAVAVSALAFSPDGRTLAVGGYQEVVLWDLKEARLARRLGAGAIQYVVRALAFSPDGKTLAVGEGTPTAAGAVRLLDVEAGKITTSFEQAKDVVSTLALSPDGHRLAAGVCDGAVLIYDLTAGKLETTINGHTEGVLGIRFSPDGKTLATAGADRTLRLWEVGTWKPVSRSSHAVAVQAVVFTPDGEGLVLALGGPSSHTLRLEPRDPGAASKPQPKNAPAKKGQPPPLRIVQPRNLDTGSGMPLDVLWATSPDRIYVACSDGITRVITPSGSAPASLAGHGDWVYRLAASLDGTLLATGSGDGTVRLWNLADNRPLAVLVQLAPRSDDWLIVTAQGYAATSSPAAVHWKAPGLKASGDALTEVLQHSDMVRQTIAGTRTAPPALK